MRGSTKRISFLFCAVSCLMSFWSVSAFGAERPFERNGPIERLDDRYHHGHYYVPRGTVVRELPTGYRPYWFHGTHLYFSGGVWYAPGPYGFMVTRPPPGLVVSTLPPFYTTVWIGGVPYYYANDVYYRWCQNKTAMRSSNHRKARTSRVATTDCSGGLLYLSKKRAVTGATIGRSL